PYAAHRNSLLDLALHSSTAQPRLRRSLRIALLANLTRRARFDTARMLALFALRSRRRAAATLIECRRLYRRGFRGSLRCRSLRIAFRADFTRRARFDTARMLALF